MTTNDKLKADTRLRAVIYARISSRKEEGTDTSIDNQKEKCKQFIQLRDYKLVGVFQESAVSGFTRNRPRYKEMVNFLDEDKADIVVIYRLDRITRNVGDLYYMLFDENGPFKRNKVELASVTELFDTNTPIGRLVIIILGAINQFFRDLVADAMMELWGNWKSQGRMHTKAPIGYQIKKGELVRDDNADNVIEQFTLFSQGKTTIAEVGKALELSWSGAKNMLQNQTYIGNIMDADGEWVKGSHKALIMPNIFNAVQTKIRGEEDG